MGASIIKTNKLQKNVLNVNFATDCMVIFGKFTKFDIKNHCFY